MNRIDFLIAMPSEAKTVLCNLASEVIQGKTRLSVEEVESLMVLLQHMEADYGGQNDAWSIFLRQPVIDSRLLGMAYEAISTYPAQATCSGYEKAIDLQLQYYLEHGNPSAEFVDSAAKMPIGRIKTVVAEYLIEKNNIDAGFLLLIEALPLAYDAMDHATFDHIGFPLGEISTPERREQLKAWLDEAKRDGKPEATVDSLEYAIDAMGGLPAA